jgi:UDP-N-acetylglucosamine diphosphorylase/glucosamine-1-phosphate N-acetyltransferase
MLITADRHSRPIPDPYTRTYHERNIFIEEGVSIKAAIINAEKGPVYLGKNASLQEGTVIRGPAAIMEGADISMGAKIRENTTIGPFCKVGGEVKNSIIFGNSNKAHEGYLGNSIIGEWCNLGADTNCSNLKNNYSNVRVWNYADNTFQDSAQQFCGVFMGDHSKTSIGTLMNTGTVIGVSANIFGFGLTPKFIPSFSWGGYSPNTTYNFNKALDSARKMMGRRNKSLGDDEARVLKEIFNITHAYRTWEN